MPDKKHGVDQQSVTGALRQSAAVLEHGHVGEAVEEVIQHAHVGERVEHVLGLDHLTEEQQISHLPPPIRPVAPPAIPKPASPITLTMSVNIARDGFTAPTRFHPEPADVLVVCCSSEKFELQNQELVAALGYQMPHMIQVPGGPASLYGLAAFKGFLSKAMGMFVDKAIELIGVNKVIIIAHEDCGAYKSGPTMVLGQLTKRLTGQGMKETQLEHLRKAARELQHRLGHGYELKAYYGNIVEVSKERKIHFEPVNIE